MAYSKANVVQTVLGNKRCVLLEITADAASGAVDSGLRVIENLTTGLKSAGSAGPRFKVNANSAGTALNGSIFVSGCTSGDVFFIKVIGS